MVLFWCLCFYSLQLDQTILNYHLIWIFLLIVLLILKLTIIIVEVCRLIYLLITYYSLSAPPPPPNQTFKNYFDLNTTWYKSLDWQLPNTDKFYRQNEQILKNRIKML